MSLCFLLLLAFGCLIESSLCFLVDISIERRQRTLRLHSSEPVDLPALLPVGLLGPPEPLHSLQVGETLQAFRRQPNGENHDFAVTRVAQDPHMFILRNFLSLEDCQRIRDQAKQRTMESAETITKGDTESRKSCNVAWIQEVPDIPLIGSITQATARMFLSPTVLKYPKSGVEDMQVLEYQKDGAFVLHHDGEPRVLTIIYYLNGVAGTWFPLARATEEEDYDDSPPLNKAQALKLCERLKVGQDGLVFGEVPGASPGHSLPVNPGDALAFYNYRDDGSGRVNWNAIHAGLPVDKGVKWIANQWFRFGMFSSR